MATSKAAMDVLLPGKAGCIAGWTEDIAADLKLADHAVTIVATRNQWLSRSPEQALLSPAIGAPPKGPAFHEAQPAMGKTGERGRGQRRGSHNLLLRLLTRNQDVLRVPTDPTVPFTNNLAEQDARMMKVRQKVSGGFRSESGSEEFATMRSVFSTARKQGWSLLETLMSDPFNLIGRLRLARARARNPGSYNKKLPGMCGASADPNWRTFMRGTWAG